MADRPERPGSRLLGISLAGCLLGLGAMGVGGWRLLTVPTGPVETAPVAAAETDPAPGRQALPVPAELPGNETAAQPTRRGISTLVDPAWLSRTAALTGIEERALAAYAGASRSVPGCRIGWNGIAAIALVESNHGREGGAVLGSDGVPRPAIIGIPLNGRGVAAIRDTDRGVLDGDRDWDRAVGPMQFIPSTWQRWASDGNGDGVTDPHQIDDAALAAARYLCASGDLGSPAGWQQAVLAYNNSGEYLLRVNAAANEYAARAARPAS